MNGWPDGAGPMPDEPAVAKAISLGGKPGDKYALAWAMYCRPDGATREEVSAACGGPQANRATEFHGRGVLEYQIANRGDGKSAYFMGEPGSNPGGPNARSVGNRARHDDVEKTVTSSIADRIRQYAHDKYIKPARERGEREVLIRAGTLHDELSLDANWANVCQALEGGKFQNLAGVPAPRRDGPPASSATVFVFQLAASEFTHENVERILKERFTPISVQKKMVAFRLPDGREIAFDREVRPAQLWVEAPTLVPQEFVSEIYSAERTRHWGLPPRLKHAGLPTSAARQVGKVSVNSFAQLQALLAWYTGQQVEINLEKLKEATMPMSAVPPSTNLILYGPPGTGKTYATASEAVLLCNGSIPDSRAELMEEYRRLMAAGRIEFVTFHQSFSYEDFVEGLRPTTESETADDQSVTANTGGFSLKPHDGVFKIISERARLDTGNVTVRRLDRSRSVYKIALGKRENQEELIQQALDKSLIHIGWGGDIDWSDDRFDAFEEIKKEWIAKKDPGASGKDPNIEMIFAFRSGLQVGDYVVISDGRDSYRAVGRVTGEYQYDPSATFAHTRPVEWIWRDDSGANREGFYSRQFRRQSAYRLDPSLVDWDALETIIVGPHAERPVEGARSHVLIIDEINRANISKVFGELITLLEVDKRLGCESELRVRLPYSKTSFGVPSNLHIIGTMNTADRSIALLDTALRRRFQFRELMPDPAALVEASQASGVNLGNLLSRINERIEHLFDREHQIGHAYFIKCRSRNDVDDVMREKVIPLLQEYFYEDWAKVAAVLGDNDGSGRFLERRALSAPSGFEQSDSGSVRYRWSVRSSFSPDSYDQMQ
jgi:DNA polymerase III delta prime subunit